MASDYLTLDRLDDEAEYYGVKIAVLGEDCDMGEVVFSHDTRRAIAAARRYYREHYLEKAFAIHVSKPQWWRLATKCGCGDTCPCPADEDGFVEHECARFGLPPCKDEEFSWMGEVCEADDPNAIAVLVLEVSV